MLCKDSAPKPVDFGSLGFGCMGMTAFYGAAMEQSAVDELMKAVYDMGYRHFDTAEIYKTGNVFGYAEGDIYNEVAMSPFLATVPRNTYTIATKMYPGKYKDDCSYETVKKALTDSLARLKLKKVELYYLHRCPTLEVTKQFVTSCKRLISEGLMDHIGLSEVSPAWLRECNKIHKISAIQQEWSMLSRDEVENMGLAETCKELGITIVAYSPLARGMLGMDKPPEDWRATNPRFSEENFKKNLALKAEVTKIADKYVKKDADGNVTFKCSAIQLSLAWLTKRASQLGVQVLPIPGTTKIRNAQSNMDAVLKIPLTDEDVAALEKIAKEMTAGARGNEAYMARSMNSQKKEEVQLDGPTDV